MIKNYLKQLCVVALLFNYSVQAQTEIQKVTNGIVSEEFLYNRADFLSCHSVTIVELPNKDLLSTYFGGTYERHPDVEIKLQRKKQGETAWSKPISVANGIQTDGKRYPTWNPVIFCPPGEDLMLYYKVGPSPKEWWGEYIVSKDNGYTWSKPVKLTSKLLGPIKNKPIYLANNVVISGSSDEKNGWQVHVERSTDNGKTWSFIGPFNDGKTMRAIQPTILIHGLDTLQMLSRTSSKTIDTEKIAETWSTDGGLTWSAMKLMDLPNNNSGIDAVTLKDGRHLLIYNHSTRNEVDMGHKGRGVLNLAVSKDGKNWEAALVLDYIDMPEKQYSYPSIIQTADGLVHVIYTWHRERIKHVVINPNQLVTYPIVNGKWPYHQIPLVKSGLN